MTVVKVMLTLTLACGALAATSCGTKPTSCDSSNCNGCCSLQTGQCELGNFATACGHNGTACVHCGNAETCVIGVCTVTSTPGVGGGSGGGEPSGEVLKCKASCQGCCDPSGNCFGGTDAQRCGSQGARCAVCVGQQYCAQGICTDSHCAGCIEPGGQCNSAGTDLACGLGGISCSTCNDGAHCGDAGVCAGGTCSGCRDALGACQPGDLNAACGELGQSCEACGIGQACHAGRCLPWGGLDAGFDAGTCAPLGQACTGGTTTCCTGTCSSAGTCENTLLDAGIPDAGPGCTGLGGGCTESVQCCAAYCTPTNQCALPPIDGGHLDGDNCTAPRSLDLSSGTALVVGTTDGFANDTASPNCGGTGGDLVYTFTTTAQGVFSATLTSTGGDGFVPVLSLRSDCSGTELACSAATSATASLTNQSLAPGTYFVWVDGLSNSVGTYSLSASLAPALVDCHGALPLVFDGGGKAAAAGTTKDAGDDATGSCGGVGPDVFYRFTTSGPARFHAAVTNQGTITQPTLYLRGGTCDVPTELTCVASPLLGLSSELSQEMPNAGTYFLVVDNASGRDFTLTASLTEPVPGESCVTPFPLDLSTGKAQDSRNTLLFANDSTSGVSGTCDKNGMGGDVVYSFTLATEKDLTVTVAASPQLHPVIYLRNQCETLTDLVCSKSGATGIGTSLTYEGAPAGKYYLWVDSVNPDEGGYTVTVSAH